MGPCRKCERFSVVMEFDDQYAFGVSGQLQVAVGSQIVVSKCLHDVLLWVLNLSNHLVSALLDDQNENLSIAHEERVKPCARLAKSRSVCVMAAQAPPRFERPACNADSAVAFGRPVG